MPPVASAVAEGRPADSPAHLHHQFLAQAALANRNMHRLMELIRRMDACDGHLDYACPTLPHYLELVCGVSRIAARQRVRVARALGSLPLIDREFAAGRLSYAKVRSLVRIATPENEREWVAKALKLPSEDLERVVARAKPGEAPSRRLLMAALNGGATRMLVDLPAEEMEIISLAIDEVRRQAGAKLSSAEALTYLCADWLGGVAGNVKTAERFEVIVHVGEDGKSWVDAEGGPAPLKPEVIERLLCDCTIRLQRESKDGTVVVSRAQRTVSEVTRRAVAARDGRRCRVPGCRRRGWLDVHHLEWISHGGRHLVSNLILLCRWHHVQHHDGKLLIAVNAKGEITFKAKAGWVLGDDGELTADIAWWRDRAASEGATEEEVAEALAILDGDLMTAYVDTQQDDRGWVFGPGTGWEVREDRVAYGERSRGIAMGTGAAKRSRGIALRTGMAKRSRGIAFNGKSLQPSLQVSRAYARRGALGQWRRISVESAGNVQTLGAT
jgi:hypothetical protein